MVRCASIRSRALTEPNSPHPLWAGRGASNASSCGRHGRTIVGSSARWAAALVATVRGGGREGCRGFRRGCTAEDADHRVTSRFDSVGVVARIRRVARQAQRALRLVDDLPGAQPGLPGQRRCHGREGVVDESLRPCVKCGRRAGYGMQALVNPEALAICGEPTQDERRAAEGGRGRQRAAAETERRSAETERDRER